MNRIKQGVSLLLTIGAIQSCVPVLVGGLVLLLLMPWGALTGGGP